MTLQPVFLQDEFANIVSKIEAKLIADLEKVSPAITGVHYLYGHPLEIIETLTQKTQGDSSRFKKYPLVALFLDFPINRTVEPGVYGEATLHLIIINGTKATYKAPQRDEYNFKPILVPIYLELMKQIGNRGDLFLIPNREDIRHEVIHRYYWGREGLYGNTANIFNDWVDAIEIKNLKLKINSNYCPKPAVNT